MGLRLWIVQYSVSKQLLVVTMHNSTFRTGNFWDSHIPCSDNRGSIITKKVFGFFLSMFQCSNKLHYPGQCHIPIPGKGIFHFSCVCLKDVIFFGGGGRFGSLLIPPLPIMKMVYCTPSPGVKCAFMFSYSGKWVGEEFNHQRETLELLMLIF